MSALICGLRSAAAIPPICRVYSGSLTDSEQSMARTSSSPTSRAAAGCCRVKSRHAASDTARPDMRNPPWPRIARAGARWCQALAPGIGHRSGQFLEGCFMLVELLGRRPEHHLEIADVRDPAIDVAVAEADAALENHRIIENPELVAVDGAGAVAHVPDLADLRVVLDRGKHQVLHLLRRKRRRLGHDSGIGGRGRVGEQALEEIALALRGPGAVLDAERQRQSSALPHLAGRAVLRRGGELVDEPPGPILE